MIKKIYFSLPKFLKTFLLRVYENYFTWKTAQKIGIEINLQPHKKTNTKPRVLFFETTGGGYGGVSKEVQVLAKYLDKNKYDVYFMFSSKQLSDRVWVEGVLPKGDGTERAKKLLEYGVKLIDFQYESIDQKFPNIIRGMNPDFFDVLKTENIDILIIITDGKSYFPSNLVRNIPIILINVFSSYTVQKNIAYNLCLSYSKDLVDKIKKVVNEKIVGQTCVPCENPTPNSVEDGKSLRKSLGIKDSDIVFGRIGRNVDCIFDPIGIRAFKKIVAKYPEAHFLIASPPPALEKIVAEEKIPNVHFLPPTSVEEEIWAFHQASDVYAHFRRDGETFGLNITEAMTCGKPIITHRSFMWNGHLEYMEPTFSRVANIDDWEEYAKFMEEFIELNKKGLLKKMGLSAKEKVDKTFSVKKIVRDFEYFIDSALNKNM